MKKSYKQKLLKDVWEKQGYIQASKVRVERAILRNPSLQRLVELSKKASTLIECGCGDGRILEVIWRQDAKFWGVDLSKQAISRARKRFRKRKNVTFKVGDVEKLDFSDDSFDFVYSSYTLEHVDKPEQAIREMVHVLKPRGLLVIVCPNSGSPFHPSASSPREGETLFKRALEIFLLSHIYLLRKPRKLSWRSVEPKALQEKRWEQDWDTVNEPNIQTLLPFLRKQGVEIVEYSSGCKWPQGATNDRRREKYSYKMRLLKMAKGVFEKLGKIGVAPYQYYGPTLFVVGRKT